MKAFCGGGAGVAKNIMFLSQRYCRFRFIYVFPAPRVTNLRITYIVHRDMYVCNEVTTYMPFNITIRIIWPRLLHRVLFIGLDN